MAPQKLYDPKCLELAKSFLEDHPEMNTAENRDELAHDIQAAIEDFFLFCACRNCK